MSHAAMLLWWWSLFVTSQLGQSGGMDNIKHSSMDKYAGGLVGCISDLILDTDYHVKLVQMSTAGRNIKHCG